MRCCDHRFLIDYCGERSTEESASTQDSLRDTLRPHLVRSKHWSQLERSLLQNLDPKPPTCLVSFCYLSCFWLHTGPIFSFHSIRLASSSSLRYLFSHIRLPLISIQEFTYSRALKGEQFSFIARLGVVIGRSDVIPDYCASFLFELKIKTANSQPSSTACLAHFVCVHCLKVVCAWFEAVHEHHFSSS